MIPVEVWAAVESLHGRSWPPQTDADADAFIAAATGESLLPLLYEETSLPPAVADALPRHRALLRLYQARNAKLRAAAELICTLFGDSVPFIIMKGADYGDRLYGNPALRPMLDVDILVPPDRMADADAILTRNGFQVEFAGGAVTRIASYNERSYVGHDVGVDVHHSFIQRVRHRIDYDAIWRDREAYELDGVRAWRLHPLHAFLYHAVAMAKDEFTSPLIRYVDFYLMLQRWPTLPRDAAPIAREWQVARAMYGALRQTSRLFPDLDLEPLFVSLLPPSTRTFLDRSVLPDVHAVPPKRTRARQLWAKFNLLDTIARRAMFGAYHAYAMIASRLIARRPSTSESAE